MLDRSTRQLTPCSAGTTSVIINAANATSSATAAAFVSASACPFGSLVVLADQAASGTIAPPGTAHTPPAANQSSAAPAPPRSPPPAGGASQAGGGLAAGGGAAVVVNVAPFSTLAAWSADLSSELSMEPTAAVAQVSRGCGVVVHSCIFCCKMRGHHLCVRWPAASAPAVWKRGHETEEK